MRFDTVSRALVSAVCVLVSISDASAMYPPLTDTPAALSSTRVHATVVFSDGAPAPGAVVLTSAGVSSVADSAGRIRLGFDHAADLSEIVVTAAATRDGVALSASTRFDGSGHGEVDLGHIVLDAQTPCEPDWLRTLGGAPGVNGTVRAIAFYDDGSGAGPQLHVAGQFTIAGSTGTFNIARWDGKEWRALGDGVGGINNTVYALATFRAGPDQPEYLYAGGDFIFPSGPVRIARWNGQSWLRVGNSYPDGAVYALRVHDDGNGPALYVGGQFLTIGTGSGSGPIARWNGVSWSGLGGRPNTAPVYVIESFAGADGVPPALYVGGVFERVGAMVVNNVAGWSGSWFALGEGTNGAVRALKVFDDGRGAGPQVYAGGNFTTAGGNPASRLARWDGAEWLPLHTGVNGTVETMAVYRHPTTGAPALYIGGDFTSAGGGPAQRLARWDSPNLVPILQAFDGSVLTLYASGDPSDPDARLVAGGAFGLVQGAPKPRIASWDTQSWEGFGSGFYTQIHAMQRFGDSLIVGGSFPGAGNQLDFISAWDGAQWRSLSTGVNGPVFAMTVFDEGNGGSPSLIVGGDFTVAGQWGAQRLARWDGQNWVPMGPGVTNTVRALAVFDDGMGAGPTVYAAGQFVTVGGVAVNRVARWNGATWAPVGDGFNNTVNALAVYTDQLTGRAHLYAGGKFTLSGATPMSSIARWDGVAWAPVGGGMSSPSGPEIYALAVYDDSLGDGPVLVAGGSFSHAGGVVALGIARWNGVSWRALPPTIDGTVYSLETFADGVQQRKSLAVGGSFTFGDGVNRTLALWDGESWRQIGSDRLFAIRSLASYTGSYGARQTLFIGGTFRISHAGDSYLTRWQGCERDTPCPGDTNADNIVNFADINAVLSAFGLSGAGLPGDVNADGVVNFADLNIVLANFGAVCR